jgi:hypothetical protein
MTTTTSVSEIYERHIRALSAAQRLKLVELIAGELAAERSTGPNRSKPHLKDMRGLGRGVWEGIDAQEYVNRLRDEWGERTT